MTRTRAIVAAGVALTVIARLFDAAPLYVPGVAFTLIGVGVPAWTWLAARGGRVERILAVRRIAEGETFEFALRVRCRPMPGIIGAVLEPLVAEPLALGPGTGSGTQRVTASIARRGLRRLEPPALLISDPFDLSPRTSPPAGQVQELLVLPRIEPIRFPAPRGDGSTPGSSSFQRSPARDLAALAEVDIDGLRPYREGTSASRIQWAALARGAGLLERRLRAETDVRPLVVLDTRGAERPEELDIAVRAAASIALELAGHGGCALLLPGERHATTLDGTTGSAWAGAHARLALIEDVPGTPAPYLAGVGARKGPTFYVAARRLQRLPAAVDAVARGSRVLVVPGRLEGRAASFEVAGCSGYELGARLALRRRAAGARAA
jgi:uncharacterized protein (DUF58 family)